MKVKYYEDADLLSFRISNNPYKYAKQNGDVIVHYSESREPVLIEIVNAAKFLKNTTRMLPKKVKARTTSREVFVTVAHKIKI